MTSIMVPAACGAAVSPSLGAAEQHPYTEMEAFVFGSGGGVDLPLGSIHMPPPAPPHPPPPS